MKTITIFLIAILSLAIVSFGFNLAYEKNQKINSEIYKDIITNSNSFSFWNNNTGAWHNYATIKNPRGYYIDGVKFDCSNLINEINDAQVILCSHWDFVKSEEKE